MNPQIIAFYLPQFHRTKEMMNGGEKASRNGLMWLWLNPYLEVTINPKYQQN